MRHSPLNDYFDQIVCINLPRRQDRWAQCRRHFQSLGLRNILRIAAIDFPDFAAYGCFYSHALALQLQLQNRWHRMLVLEDDFEPIHRATQRIFDLISQHVPSNFDMLYLGGIYTSPPIARVNAHCLRVDRISTTASYGISLPYVERISTLLDVPIDAAYSELASLGHHYCLQPRLFAQRSSHSDIEKRSTDYLYNYIADPPSLPTSTP